ncbi:hypothetical protein EUGRSUZ_I00698 [Eucalyptus grandis]|uniref:Uncharacterized protein n=2 Tax=Eucalyptus grandis TaxID=71139 RepID=A0ACC3JDH8_EUCGR|nr:hypothetical protein EUGRSUZ_I00698 [Eucalyptus grandis]
MSFSKRMSVKSLALMQWSIRSLKAIKTTSTINSLKNTTKQHDMVPSVFVNKKKTRTICTARTTSFPTRLTLCYAGSHTCNSRRMT